MTDTLILLFLVALIVAGMAALIYAAVGFWKSTKEDYDAY